MLPRLALIAAVAALLVTAAADAASHRPKLLVLIVVDQFRTDYIEQYSGQWSRGLRRLIHEGAWFRRAAYPYMNTVTCAGHATISTGAVPSVHGLVLNEWWDRQAQRSVSCTQDERAAVVNERGARARPHSSRRLLVPALADEMRRQLSRTPKVAALSMKARSALMLAGQQGGDVVMWFESGAWTWPAPREGSAMPAVAAWLRTHPVEADRGRVWKRSLPPDKYLHDDDPEGKQPLEGWGPALPHALGTGDGFYARWETSPFADEYLARLAAHVVSTLDLGRSGTTDLLAVSFSALDRIGHRLGPRSHEIQDALVRLDGALGGLFDHLDREVGKGSYTVAFSSDHGVGEVPEQQRRAGVDAGRLRSADVAKRVDDALTRVLGPGRYVARVFYTDLYFLPGVYDRLRADSVAMKAALEALRNTPGIGHVYRGDELAARKHAGDPIARAAALGYHKSRSGDLILVPKRNWIVSTSAATHGTAHPYDVSVPVVFSGYGIRRGTYLSEATPADVAPTLGALAGVRLPHATGRVLNEALGSAVREPATA
ncbi:MAG TPA: alkaline phosphatase family protein, partial [Vicinamibacterales bacterium]|nr:alkaline phosphatase family protein [Vicinamibacterales bacterium]